MNKPIMLVLFAAAFIFLHPYTVCAQSVSLAGAQQTTVGSGLKTPYAVAVDKAGDVFIADCLNNQVVEVPAGGGAQTTLGSGLSCPYGVALDGAGDVFIGDYNNNRVVKVPAGGGAQTTVASGLNLPYGVAVDGAGDVFVAEPYRGQVVKVPAGGGAQTTVGTGWLYPRGVAVDIAGDVFIADQGHNRVVEFPAGGGQTTVPASGLNNPTGVAVDGAGDVFIADDGNSRVVEVPAVAVNFGSVNICPGGQTTPAPCSLTHTLNYSVNVTTTFGASPTVLTLGASNLDFTLGSTTCTGTITAPASCTVNVQFAPLAPGLRVGAVQLMDNSGTLLVTTLIQGAGQGPAMAFGPGAQTTVASGLSEPVGVAVDGAGDVFIAAAYNQQVVEVPAGGGAQTTVPASGLSYPYGVAVDGAGDVFIGDYSNNRVVEVPAGGGAQTTVGSGLNSPYGVAVDGAGDVFIADAGNNRVVEVPAGGGAQTTVGSGLSWPTGVAVDGAGDVFIADYANNQVVEVPAGGGAQTTVGSGLYLPHGVAVDGAGDVFIADFAHDRVVEVPANGGAQTTVGSGLVYPFAVAVDGAGDVFIADAGNGRVVEVQRSQPPTFSFAATALGSTSTDSPQSVTVQNIGNQLLDAVAPGLSIGSNSFEQVAGSGTPADCTSSFSLQPGASCNLSVSFIPQTGGSISSAATFTDNALNATTATQNIGLGGTGGTLATLTITASSATMTYGGAAPTITPMYSGFVNGDGPSVVTGIICTTTASSSSPAGSSPSTSCSDASAPSYYTIQYVSGSVTVSKAPLTITASSTSMTYGGTPPAVTPGYSAFAGSDTVASLTTAPTCVTSASNTTPAGTDTGANTCAGAVDPNYNFTYVAGNVTVGKASLTITASSTSMTYGGTPPAVTPGYSAFAGTDTVASLTTAPTCVTTATSSTLAGTDTGANTCSGAVDANYTFTYVAGNVTVGKANPKVGLGSSLNPVLSLNPVTFTATVSSAASTPTGTVSFFDGTTLLGSAVTLTAGLATYTTSSLAIAAHSITAVYSGDSNFVTVTSAVLTQTVEDFTLTMSSGGNTLQTALPGGKAQYVFQLGPSSGTTFPSAITLTASGLPAGATATFTPATIPAGAGSTSVNLLIQLANQIVASNPAVHFGVAPGFSPALMLNAPPGLSPGLISGVAAVSDRRSAVGTPPLQSADLKAGATFLPRHSTNPVGRGLALVMVGGIFLLPFGGRMRRSRGRAGRFVGLLLLTLALTCAALGFTACGGGGNGFFGQQVQTYTVTITGTSGGLTHTTTVTLTVE